MITTLTGDNDYMQRRELDDLLTTFRAEHGEFGIERLDGEDADLARLQTALTSLPFLADKKLVVLRAPSANKQFVEAAEALLVGVPESTDVIIVEPKLDKRLAYYKLLKKVTDFRDFVQLDVRSLVGWLTAEAKRAGGTISGADAQYLLDRLGTNQQLLDMELEKLLLYDPKVTSTTIDLLTEATPQSTVFELLEAAFAGNRGKTLELYVEQRAMKVEPPQIIAMITWQLHVIAVIKTAGNRSVDQIAAEARLNPFVVRRSLTIARSLELTRLEALISDLLTIDARSKRTALNVDDALQRYLLMLAG